DLLIGASASDSAATDAGAAYLVLGSATPTHRDLASADVTFLGEASGDAAGSAVAGVGDVDGDGLDDVAIGAPGSDQAAADSGMVYLVHGGAGLAGGSLALADRSLTGVDAGARAGAALAGVGDVDGDGLDDLLAGAWGDGAAGPMAGAAYLVLGSTRSW
ncbi:MAG: hypothetical protein ABIO70_28520, partial [Pseudomonadota bacterium]